MNQEDAIILDGIIRQWKHIVRSNIGSAQTYQNRIDSGYYKSRVPGIMKNGYGRQVGIDEIKKEVENAIVLAMQSKERHENVAMLYQKRIDFLTRLSGTQDFQI